QFRSGSIDLQPLRTRPDQRLVIGNLPFIGSRWSVGCHIFDRRRRLCANGLDLSRLRKLHAGDSGTRCRGCELAVRNIRLETSTPDVGTFCRTKFRFDLVQEHASHLEHSPRKRDQPNASIEKSVVTAENIFATAPRVQDVADCYFYHTMEL